MKAASSQGSIIPMACSGGLGAPQTHQMLRMWEEGKPLAADSGPVVRCLNPKHVGGWDVQAPAPGTTAFRHDGRAWPLEYVSLEGKGRCLGGHSVLPLMV